MYRWLSGHPLHSVVISYTFPEVLLLSGLLHSCISGYKMFYLANYFLQIYFSVGGWGLYFAKCVCYSSASQPMEVYVDDEAKLTLHGLQQHYVKLKENEKNKKLFELLDILEFNQVLFVVHFCHITCITIWRISKLWYKTASGGRFCSLVILILSYFRLWSLLNLYNGAWLLLSFSLNRTSQPLLFIEGWDKRRGCPDISSSRISRR